MRKFEDQSEVGFCNDPDHDDLCECGARPDYEYEKRVEKQL